MNKNYIYFLKYLNYKEKYLKLLNQQGGAPYRWYYETRYTYKKFDDEDNIRMEHELVKNFNRILDKRKPHRVIFDISLRGFNYTIYYNKYNGTGSQKNLFTEKIRLLKRELESLSTSSQHCSTFQNDSLDIKSKINIQDPYNEAKQRKGDPVYDDFRKKIINETIDFLCYPNRNEQIVKQAEMNLEKFYKLPDKEILPNFKLYVDNEDWGKVTQRLTKKYKKIFAVLNMANASKFGGGYLTGARAQEENMFRRTNCSCFHNVDSGIQTGIKPRNYNSKTTNLINAINDEVYLDIHNKRVCFRDTADAKYEFLKPEDYFQFYELRAAAYQLEKGQEDLYDELDGRRRINAQFETLKKNNIRHVVLSAIGCGAFHNPPEKVSNLYKEYILTNIDHFDVIAFAIIDAGNDEQGKASNYEIFKKNLIDSNDINNDPLVIKRNKIDFKIHVPKLNKCRKK